MYFPDNASYSYGLPRSLPGVECIGWLEPSHEFRKKKQDDLFLRKLLKLTRRESVNKMRGIHHCPFCGDLEIRLEEGRFLLGHAELWVPGNRRDVLFVAPNLIYHYCDKHDYEPPREFVEAVLAFDFDSEWSGVVEADKRIDALYAEDE